LTSKPLSCNSYRAKNNDRGVILKKILAGISVLCITSLAPSLRAQSSTPTADQNPRAKAATADPKDLEALTQQIDEIFKALKAKQKDQFHKLVNDLRMPDEQSWFLKVFGTEMGRNMAERYADEWPRFEEDLEMRLKTDHDDKRTDISPHEATDPVFPGASQIAAIMKTPTVLYAVSASKHGKEEWNLSGVFVADNGSFRCIPPSVFAMVPGTKPGRIRIGGNVQRPKVVKSVPPIYPQEARLAHVTGTVVLHVIIGSDGSVQEVSYVSGPMPLSSAAADAVHQWRFEVTRLNDMPVEVDTTIPVTFSISY
jgi:TonB family protein